LTANTQPRSGYTLPVFACAAAIAAYRCLVGERVDKVSVDLLEPPQTVTIPIEQVGKIGDNQAIGITYSDPGDNLDLTRNTPVWAIASKLNTASEKVTILGGEGVGKIINQNNQAAIYRYARRLIQVNLEQHLPSEEYIEITIILPEGRQLAQRTSNAAFGVIEGLSLLGTTGISQPLSAPAQLEIYRQELLNKAQEFDTLVFCIGENGLDLAARLGLKEAQIVKTANWIGPMLATAGMSKISSILLFGYHGKLMKLAGGIFHTHHELADGRREIMTSHLAILGAPKEITAKVFTSPTTEAALTWLRQQESQWVDPLYSAIAATIDQRSQDYIFKQTNQRKQVGSILFDGQRQIIIKSIQGQAILDKIEKREGIIQE